MSISDGAGAAVRGIKGREPALIEHLYAFTFILQRNPCNPAERTVIIPAL